MKHKAKFPYRDIKSKKYLKDRDELFAENGNGWWWYQGTILGKKVKGDLSGKQKKEENK